MDVNVAPTKANLMSAKSTLDFSKKGYQLLDQKRNVLIREMMGLVDNAKDIQERINTIFNEAYEALKTANITMGVSGVEDIADSVPETGGFKILYKSVMGVEIPNVKYERPRVKPTYSFYQTNSAMDVAFMKFWDIRFLVLELAEIESSVYKLAVQIKKTQKRANALENIQIPKYTEMVKYIQDSLEEKEREEFFRLKVVKKKNKKKHKDFQEI